MVYHGLEWFCFFWITRMHLLCSCCLSVVEWISTSVASAFGLFETNQTNTKNHKIRLIRVIRCSIQGPPAQTLLCKIFSFVFFVAGLYIVAKNLEHRKTQKKRKLIYNDFSFDINNEIPEKHSLRLCWFTTPPAGGTSEASAFVFFFSLFEHGTHEMHGCFFRAFRAFRCL